MKTETRRIIGFVPSPLPVAFAIPIYQNDEGHFEFHVSDEATKTIVGFTFSSMETPEHMIEMPKTLQRNIETGDPMMFVISGSHLLYVGTAQEIVPHIKGIKDNAGKGLLKELEMLESLIDTNILNHIIDCDKAPLIPCDDWKVEEHIKGGQFTWNPEKVKLFLSVNQKDGKSIEGNKLRKELKDEPVMNANLLDYLLDHPHLIPEEWKGKAVSFWGTIYRDSDEYLYFRFLCFVVDRWEQGYNWLGVDLDDRGATCVSVI